MIKNPYIRVVSNTVVFILILCSNRSVFGKECDTFIWQNSTGLSKPDVVLKPWTSIKTFNDGLEVLGRTYRFNSLCLPSSVVSQDWQLFAEPSYLMLNGKRLSIVNERGFSWEDHSDSTATLVSTFERDGLRLALRTKVEFDGFTRTTLTVSPSSPAKIKDLTLVFPLRKDHAKYLNYSAAIGDMSEKPWRPGLLNSFLINGRWKSSFLPVLWLGDQEAGFCWFAESTQGWFTRGDATEIEIADAGDVIELKIHFVQTTDKPLLVSVPFSIEFGWMATPAKPQPSGWRNWHLINETNEQRERKVGNISILWHSLWSDALGSPRPREPELLTNLVKNCHKDGYKAIIYLALTDTMADIGSEGGDSLKALEGKPQPITKELEEMGDEWNHSPCIIGWSRGLSSKHWGVRACMHSSWPDFLLYYIKEAIEKYDIDGLYLDNSVLINCDKASHGCGYVGWDGKRHVTNTLFAQREFYKKAYKLFTDAGKDPIIVVHSSTDMIVPAYSFIQATLDGEQFNSSWRYPYTFEHLVPLDFFRAHYHGNQFGVAPIFLPSPAFQSETQCREHLAYMLINDTLMQKGWLDAKPLEKVWTVTEAFGFGKDSIEFTGYWKNRHISTEDKNVKISFWAEKDRVMMVAANLGQTDQKNVKIHIDEDLLGEIKNLVDAMTGIPVGHKNGEFSLAISNKDFRLLQWQKKSANTKVVRNCEIGAAFDYPTPERLPKNSCRDSSGLGNYIGNSLYCSSEKGRIGSGVRFQPGNGGFILIPYDKKLDISKEITIDAWIWLDPMASCNGYQKIISKSSTDVSRDPVGFRAYDLAVGPNGDLQFWLSLNSNRVLLEAPINSVKKGVWTHLAATYDGSLMCIYVNGLLTASHEAKGVIFESIGPLILGNTYGYGFRDQFEGILDEVYLWSIARSEVEIKYDMGTPPKAKIYGLIGCWRFGQ